jgi:hypothetical protein
MAVSFINVELQQVARMSEERDIQWEISELGTEEPVRTIAENWNAPLNQWNWIMGNPSWKLVRSEEARAYFYDTLLPGTSSPASFKKGLDRMWKDGVDENLVVVSGTTLTHAVSSASIEVPVAQQARFMQLVTEYSWGYAVNKLSRAKFLKSKGVVKIEDGVCQFNTVKKNDGSRVIVTMRALELNDGMYSAMLTADLAKMLEWDSSKETAEVQEALAEKIASTVKSLSEKSVGTADLYRTTICGLVLNEQTVEPAAYAKKVYNCSAKSQAKNYIDRVLKLQCSKLRSYVIGG